MVVACNMVTLLIAHDHSINKTFDRLMPKNNVYGTWPSSGEIDLMESRGNLKLFDGDTNVGTEQFGSTLHFGPRWDANGWATAHSTKNFDGGLEKDFHVYKLVWTDSSLTFFLDDEQIGVVNADDGFWKRAGFDQSGRDNPWKRGTLMAPFDQEFYIILNLAVGGTNGYFSDGFRNEGAPKPWANTSPNAMGDFWAGKDGWLTTWKMDTDNSHFQIDYVRVYAL